MFEQFIHHLKEQFKQPLPGTKAQYKMAPTHRLVRVANMKKLMKKPRKGGVLLLLYPNGEQIGLVLLLRPK